MSNTSHKDIFSMNNHVSACSVVYFSPSIHISTLDKALVARLVPARKSISSLTFLQFIDFIKALFAYYNVDL